MLHGHRYVVEITFTNSELDKLGRILDFGVIKDIFSKWVDENLDHNTILSQQDKKLGEKIAEELWTDESRIMKTENSRIYGLKI